MHGQTKIKFTCTVLSRRFGERTVSIWTNSITLNTGAEVPPEVGQKQTTRRTNPKHDIIWTNTAALTWKPAHTCFITFSWAFKYEFLFFHEISSGTHCPNCTHSTNYSSRGCLTVFVTISLNCSYPTPTHKFVPNHFTVQYNVFDRHPLHTSTRAQPLALVTRDNFPLHALHVKYPSLYTSTAGSLLQ